MQRSPFPRIFAITFVLGLLMAFAAGAAFAQSTSGNIAGTVVVKVPKGTPFAA